jgi:hypothetical protein
MEPVSAKPVPKGFKTEKKGDLKIKPDPIRCCTPRKQRRNHTPILHFGNVQIKIRKPLANHAKRKLQL